MLSLVHCMGKAAVATRQWACCHWFTVRGRQPLQQDIGRAFFSSLYGEGSRCNKTVGVLSLVHCTGKAAVATRQWACCHWFTVCKLMLLSSKSTHDYPKPCQSHVIVHPLMSLSWPISVIARASSVSQRQSVTSQVYHDHSISYTEVFQLREQPMLSLF